MPFIRYTAKKILMITALSNTLAPMVKTYIRAGVIIESVIDCVRWASLACPGAFYIYENFLKKFLPEPNIGHYLRIPIEISILFGNSEHPFPERKNMPFRSRVQPFI